MISKSLSVLVEKHAKESYPNECCGLIVDGQINGRDIEGEYVPLTNMHERPDRAFRISQQDYLKHSDRITAIVHSHPDGPDAPSKGDMETQISMGVPFVIISTDGSNCLTPFEFGDQLQRFPLEGRPFRHAVTDCYEAGRDYFYMNLGINLPPVPRDWEWWRNGEDLYTQKFLETGFRLLNEGEEPQKHDAFFVSVGSRVPNHGGVYLGDGRIFHHLGSTRHGPYSQFHLSVSEFGLRWMAYRPTFIRHRSLDK